MSRDNFIDLFQDSSEISDEERKRNEILKKRMSDLERTFTKDFDELDYQIDPNLLRKDILLDLKDYKSQLDGQKGKKRVDLIKEIINTYDDFSSFIQELRVKRKERWEAENDNVDLKFEEAFPEEIRMINEGFAKISSEQAWFVELARPSKIIWRRESGIEQIRLLIDEWIGGKDHYIVLNEESVDDFIIKHFIVEGEVSLSDKGDYILWSSKRLDELAWWIYCLHQAELIFVELDANGKRDSLSLTEAKYADFICTHFLRFTNKGNSEFVLQSVKNAYSSFRTFFDEDGVLLTDVLKEEKKSYLDIWNFVKEYLE